VKKLINGKLYSTKTASCIGEWDNGIYGGDFRSCEEALYKTDKGAYFIHGEGGAMSKYAEPCGNNSVGGGSDIIAVTADEAFEWMQDKGLVDEALQEFPDRVEEA